VETKNPFRAIAYSGRRRNTAHLCSLGVLRRDGTYTPIHAHDYAAWMTRPRDGFPVGMPSNKAVIEALAESLNDLFADGRYPPVSELRRTYGAAMREAMDAFGLQRIHPNGEWFGEPLQ
jgi:hypothetical protein